MVSERESRFRTDGAPADAAREAILRDHRAVLQAVVDGADRCAGVGADGATDREQIVDGLQNAIDRRGLGEPLLDALETGVNAAGYDFQVDPVPAPPYLVVTARGPILRATVAEGRLVVGVEVFAVRRGDGGPRYVRTGDDPNSVLSTRFRSGGDPA